jgi:transcriptional regulator with XRE-family HTH domain
VPAPELPDWIHDERRRIGEHIRHLRERANWSQGDLVRHSGIDRRTLQRIESGETDTRLSRLQCIARALGVPVGELLHLSTNPANGTRARGGGA